MTSLFDKLGQHIDITAGRNAEAPMHPPNTPAQHNPEIQDVMIQKERAGMQFTHSLIKHLDQLYGKLLAGEISNLALDPKDNPKTRVIQGQTNALILEEKESYFNQGNSNVTESF